MHHSACSLGVNKLFSSLDILKRQALLWTTYQMHVTLPAGILAIHVP